MKNRTAARALTMALGAVCGITLLSTQSAVAAAATSAAGPLSIRISGNRLIDGRGRTLHLRGVNVSGLEGTSIQGWAWIDEAKTQYDPWADAHLGTFGVQDYPSWDSIKAWRANIVRLPLNEASWLGLTTYDNDGSPRNADPGGSYRAVVMKSVKDAVAAGLLVILDLHWAGPDVKVPGQPLPVPSTPMNSQNPMANADHSIEFWTSIANTFKTNPAVMFELFNEPYFNDALTPDEDPWVVWLHGGIVTKYVSNGVETAYAWKSAGMQSMLDAVRATGATNVVLVGGVNWAGDLAEWLKNKPVDPLHQTAAVWHAYPKSSIVGNWGATDPAWGRIQYVYAQLIMDANIPLIITETGDHSAPGTQGSPFVSLVLPWADAHGISYLGWGWDPWAGIDDDLILDAAGHSTDGYGRYFQQHLKCVADGNARCP